MGGAHSRHYVAWRTAAPIALDADWDADAWRRSTVLRIGHFHPKSSEHRPLTQARLAWDESALYLIFRVEDRFVRCVHWGYQSDVYEDACVEFFVRPVLEKGYFNFEMNACGQLLCGYVEDPTRDEKGDFARSERLPGTLGKLIEVRGFFEAPQPKEIEAPLVWTTSCRIPLRVFESYTGPLGELRGQAWRANFNKCAENNSHPHWASWTDIGPDLNFHQPGRFGSICFE